MQRLSASFVLGYHGCDRAVANRLLAGDSFKESQNDYDWLGWGIYFWEANPKRGLDFAAEAMKRPGSKIKVPAVIGAVVDLGSCLDLMSAVGIDMVRTAYESLDETLKAAGKKLPQNRDRLRRQLDCAVIQHLHAIYENGGGPSKPCVLSSPREGKSTLAQRSTPKHISRSLCAIPIASKACLGSGTPISLEFDPPPHQHHVANLSTFTPSPATSPQSPSARNKPPG